MGSLAEVSIQDFPPNFLFGTATSAYQVEGATKTGNRGRSIWDSYVSVPGIVSDGSTADIACDQYNKFKDDVQLLADLGFKAYRFSISWPRIFPDGFGEKINEEGVQYYNNLIDCLLEKGITPFVTLYHWDLPQPLEDELGGWLSPDIPKYFARYAEVCFDKFGDRVKHWITINEPFRFAFLGYSIGVHAPGRSSNRERCSHGDSSVETYVVGHHALLAHAAAVQIYRSKFKNQCGIIGITVDSEWAEPLTDSIEDKEACQRHLEFVLGWFLDPIYFGHYPACMQKTIGKRLPQFTEEQKQVIKGSIDFIGLNHYYSAYVTSHTNNVDLIGWEKDVNTNVLFERDGKPIGDRAASWWMYIVPWGLTKLLKWITERYNCPTIYITENGMDDQDDPSKPMHEFLQDSKRTKFYQDYLFNLAEAIRDGSDVRGYFAWSFLDNFEWSFGYTKRYGVVFVDHVDNQKRYPKASALWFKKLLTSPLTT